jgi:hypothetical protein
VVGNEEKRENGTKVKAPVAQERDRGQFFLRISSLNEQRKMAIPLYQPEIIET